MIEIRINNQCQAWGQCVFDLPKVFDLVDGDRKTWRYVTDDSDLDAVRSAAHNCPNRAISFVEDYDG